MTCEFGPLSQLSSADVYEAIQGVKGQNRTNEALRKGELRHLVLESLVQKYNLPLENIVGIEIPNFKDASVMNLDLQLDQFDEFLAE